MGRVARGEARGARVSASVPSPPISAPSVSKKSPADPSRRPGRIYTEKLSPQEQEALAFGLVNLKPPAINADE